MDDVALVTRMAGGDREALGAFYDRYAGLTLAVARRVLGSGSDRESEDLVHDVFLEAWQRAGDFDPARGTPRTWLLLRTRSRALDRKRSPRLSRAVSLDAQESGRERIAGGEDPSVAADRGRVRAALQTLPIDQRTVLVLAFFEGLSSSEIAAQLGIPIGTVKSRAAGARHKLRAALGVEREGGRR